jgi:hypothetical protein
MDRKWVHLQASQTLIVKTLSREKLLRYRLPQQRILWHRSPAFVVLTTIYSIFFRSDAELNTVLRRSGLYCNYYRYERRSALAQVICEKATRSKPMTTAAVLWRSSKSSHIAIRHRRGCYVLGLNDTPCKALHVLSVQLYGALFIIGARSSSFAFSKQIR